MVKTLHTPNAQVMVNRFRPGEHSTFVAGDDAAVRTVARGLLGDPPGWPADAVLDLGRLRSARGPGMYVPLWLSLWSALGPADFDMTVTRA